MQEKMILFYSYSGNTRRLAGELAKTAGAVLYEVKDKKRPGALKAFTAGCFASLRMKPGEVEPITADLSACERVILMAPIWAGHPAPPFNNMLEALPQGKKVEVWAVSGGGSSRAKEKVKAKLEQKGCELVRYMDVGPQFNFEYFDANL